LGGNDYYSHDSLQRIAIDGAGRIVAAGTPEQVAETPGSYTGAYLARVLAPRLEEAKRRA
jgi:hypothetical protein